jgi:hypothetical protein
MTNMQTYKVGDKVSPLQVNRHKLWGEVVGIRRWGRGYSCRVRWDADLWRLNGKKHPPEGWYPQTKLWPADFS